MLFKQRKLFKLRKASSIACLDSEKLLLRRGLEFPINESGNLSTSCTGKHIISIAMRSVGAEESRRLALLCDQESDWRHHYNQHFINMVELSAKSSEAAMSVAKAGIDALHNCFEFVDPVSGEPWNFSKYMANAKSRGSFSTLVVSGDGKNDTRKLGVRYKGRDLSGDALKNQLQKWAAYGTIEKDAAEVIAAVAEEQIDLHGVHFVLLGAGAAVGPLDILLKHGATVVCVDVPGAASPQAAKVWKDILLKARNSSGTVVLPLSDKSLKKSYKTDDELVQDLGCCLLEQPAEILNWLSSFKERLVIGNYTYMDADKHVRLALAADAIIQHLRIQKPDTALAFLCTPTDVHIITEEAHQASVRNYGLHPGRLLEAAIHVLSFGRMLRRNALPPLPNGLKIVDGLSIAQGPNYALAKRIQHWRAMIEYEAGATVSTHIAPPTTSKSVVRNKMFGWAYDGMPYFKPYEIFDQETTNGLMGALLIADITHPDSAAHPANRAKYGIRNPLEIFRIDSLHGGVWRAGYKIDSIGEFSVLAHFLGGPKRVLPVVAGVVACCASLAFIL